LGRCGGARQYERDSCQAAKTRFPGLVHGSHSFAFAGWIGGCHLPRRRRVRVDLDQLIRAALAADRGSEEEYVTP